MLVIIERRRLRLSIAETRAALAALACIAALPAAQAEDIAMSDDNWRFTSETAEIISYQGAPALSLFNATAWLEGDEFRDGTIEFKVSFPNLRGFLGVRFRARDGDNYEHFYLRPHQSGLPDANQYTPVFHGNTGWQIYYGPRYSASTEYRFGDWVEVKLVVSGDVADIYIDSDAPVLHVADLKRETAAGAIGFDSFLTHAFVKDVRVTPQKRPTLAGKAAAQPELPQHIVSEWRVSVPAPPLANPADAEALNAALEAATWTRLAVEENGIANLGRLGSAENGRNLIFARLTVDAERAMTRRLDFGYSDKVTVFVNGAPVYSGNNTYRSRDYRYLGTVGLFDTVFIPLTEGKNDIVFAVEEAFGGWAISAAFDDIEGIAVE